MASRNEKIVAGLLVAFIVGYIFVPSVATAVNNLLGGNVIGDKGEAPQSFTLYKKGTGTALASVDVYAWIDRNGNGGVDLGEVGDGAGEIETIVSDANGLVTTQESYPIGQEVLYQCHLANYEVATFARVRDSMPNAHSGAALSVSNAFMTLTDTGVTRVSIGGELLVTASTDYNWSSSGSTPSVDVRHTSTSTDSGINEAAFTHWGTGKQYSGTFIGVQYLNQDFVDLNPDGYDGIFIGDTTTFTWYNVAGYFNDESLAGDEVFHLYFNLDITADGDMALIGFYNTVELSKQAIGVWTTVIGTSETGLDIDDGL